MGSVSRSATRASVLPHQATVIVTMFAPLAFVLGAAVATAAGYAKRKFDESERTPSVGLFDAHLPSTFEDAVTRALREETDLARLQGFGEALVADYPIAAGYLFTRKANLSTATGSFTLRPTPQPPPLHLLCDPADAAQTVLCAIVLQPQLVRLSSPALARRLQVPELVAQAVLSSTRTAGAGIVVDASALRRLVGVPKPPEPVDAAYTRLVLLAMHGKPAAKISAERALEHYRIQNPNSSGGIERAKRTAHQALMVAAYTKKTK